MKGHRLLIAKTLVSTLLLISWRASSIAALPGDVKRANYADI